MTNGYLRKLAKAFIHRTKPYVKRLAEAYDLRVDWPLVGYGVNPLIFEDEEGAREITPKTVWFNTGSGTIYVGKDTVFGHEVFVLTGKHMGMMEARAKGAPLHQVAQGLDIRIGRGCYIGSRAVLIAPLVVGDYAMIAAGAVVTQDVPSRAFVAGNPARVFKIFEEDELEPAKESDNTQPLNGEKS